MRQEVAVAGFKTVRLSGLFVEILTMDLWDTKLEGHLYDQNV
jgi:hypothetical protein